MGAAYLAGMEVHFWASKEEVLQIWEIDQSFRPNMDEAVRAKKLSGWKKAVAATRGWAKDE
jgi:glycerol kinase